MVPGEEEDASSLVNKNRKIAYLPSVSTTQYIWYKGRWMSITRDQEENTYYGRKADTLQIRYDLDVAFRANVNTLTHTSSSIMTRHHRVLNELLLEAKKEYMAAQDSSISIYVSDS